ncbi:hypothetical protein H310_04213 [Aphanomyces invadans]|uniref:Uncharacterized protein n=1 Tax=Aphanomyces invadans TaxID=157072 RepID=A0A024UHZ4_9STRA|nr:hypothetical protein H310_04213 [Aphanomyces invadans]ETW05243.1 hypothetical protein H310_04213 [Aphanomyces invadans]|eukprot:XP_008866681.1 hypothetical protein H310_04213 [Aphanomyces invadans]
MFAALKDGAQQAFRAAMSEIPGQKAMVVDGSLQVLLEVLSRGGGGKGFFDDLGIAQIVTLVPHLDVDKLESSQIVFLVRPQPVHVKTMADVVLSAPRRHTFAVVWLPQCIGVCELEMERQGLAGIVREIDIPLFLVPCDELVWSLCWEEAFIDLFIHHDTSVVSHVVRSLLHLEQFHGVHLPHRVTAHGPAAQHAKNLLDSIHGASRSKTPATFQFDQCILLDRMEDPISLLVTPLHYEGLLDSVIGIDHGTILHGIPKKKHVLDDDLFASIRNVDFQLVTSLLHDMSTSLQVDEAATRSTTSIDQLRIRAALAAAKTNLSLHVDLAHRVSNCSTDVKDVVSDDVDGVQRCVHAEQIILSKKLTATTPSSAVSSITGGADAAFVGTVLEEALFRDPPLELTKLIKLVCLHSLVHGGFKHATFEWLQTQICHTYGHRVALPLVANLVELNWLFPSSSRRSNPPWMKRLRQHDPLIGTSRPLPTTRDISFMFPTTGYAPISVLQVQDTATRSSSSTPLSGRTKQRVLVYYIGGVTVAEIAAYRWLNQGQDQIQYVVACTAISNTARLLRQLVRSP